MSDSSYSSDSVSHSSAGDGEEPLDTNGPAGSATTPGFIRKIHSKCVILC